MEKIIKVITKYKGYLICITIILISIVSIIFQNIDRKNNLKINDQNIIPKDGKIVVYITGAVKSPGIYYLNSGARLSDALDICGGVSEKADLDKLNLASKVVDSDKIAIPLKQEKIEEKEQIPDNEIQNKTNKVNINTASQSELETLIGIGPSTAKKILKYREEKSYNEIEDIMQVQGIGQSKFDKIKDNICTD